MVDECEDDWRRPDLQGGSGLALRMHRKADLGVWMTSRWLGHSNGARGFI